ncbi:MAG TPA: hypothetical protein VKY85_25430 [Candidatus Angelobacter sp.]|jgi:hypothetical protein|nr:hypothetical protein [Candidatus Angelobacter sp.]
MESDWRKRIQITLVVFLVIALARVGIIFYDRTHEPDARKPQPLSSSSYHVTLDDYVTQHKLYPYDLKSAREVVGKPVWVRSGNQLAYYPYGKSSRQVELTHTAGLLAPLEKLEIKDVIAQKVRGQKQVMAVFAREGSSAEYAVTVGKVSSGSYDFFINDVFMIDDPHQLYNYWPADVWSAIDHHEVKPGMNELQASFALGTNIRAGRGDYGNREVQYINGDKSTMVSFSDNKATSVDSGPHP